VDFNLITLNNFLQDGLAFYTDYKKNVTYLHIYANISSSEHIHCFNSLSSGL